MSSFKEINTPKELEQPRVNDAERPALRESDIPLWNPDNKANDTLNGNLSDVYDSIFKSFGLMTETNDESRLDTNESVESKDYSQYLEKGENEKYYDKETGKAYDSIEAWKKAQETLAKRYDGVARYFEEKAKKGWARFKNAEQNGGSEDEKWEHYRRSQEYYAKSKECKEKADHIRENLGENENSDKSDTLSKEKTDSNQSDVDDTAEENNENNTTDTPEKGSPIQNKVDGLRREAEVRDELEETYPPEKGYEIISEAYLRDKDGNIVKDPETGKARRIDYVVVKDGKVVDSIEVTSQTADKSDQLAKESRVREKGGNYIRDNKGNLIEMPSTVQTRVERRD